MGSNILNETSSDCEIVDIIDLDDTEKTAEDEILEWGAKIRRRLKTFAAADCNKVLGSVMKEYFSSVQLMAKSYEDHDLFKKQVFDHIHVLYLYYTEMKSFVKDVYLKNMENILTLYCNLELTHIHSLKQRNLSKKKCDKRRASAVKRIIHILTMYLLERRDLILHVLMKMDTSKVQHSFPDVLKALYMHFLLKVPEFNLSEESFCRNYIVFQKWKEVQNEREWEHIDKLMYGKFKQSPESIKNNETLKKILIPPSPNEADVILNIFCSYRAISNAYFKHINTKQTFNINDFDFNIDLEEDEPSSLCLDDDDSEEALFQKKFSEIERTMSTANFKCNASIDVADMLHVCKTEPDDDDVEFVGYVESPSPEDSILSEVYDFNHRKTPPKICKDLENIVPSSFAIASSSIDTKKNQVPPEPPISPKVQEPTPVLPEVTQPVETEVIQNPEPPVKSPPPQISSTEKICDSSNEPIVSETMEVSATPVEKLCDSTVISDQSEVTTTTEKPILENLENRNVEVELSPTPKVTVTKEEEAPSKAVETKSINVQAGGVGGFYSGYSGIPTPPFDGATEEQNRRNNHVYANAKIDTVTTRTVDVQVDLNDVDSYVDYGLTPPNDPHSDDVTSCVNDKEHQCDRVSEKVVTFENVAESQPEIAPSKETCKDSSSYDTNKDDLDTGQKTPVLNGNLMKRTNGQNKDVTTSKVLFSTPSKQRLISGAEFSKFEDDHWNSQNENQELDDFFLGPVTKAKPIQASSFLSAQEQFNIFGSEPSKPNSGSSSPVSDSNSPLYEQGLSDFRSHYHEMKRHHPPLSNCKVPPGILKKGRSRRNSESSYSYKEEKKSVPPCGVSDSYFKEEKKSVQLPKTRKCSVRLERLDYLERLVSHAVKWAKRIDFDKSTRGITARDVVRYLSPPRITVILPQNLPSSGSLAGKKTEHLDKKPKKRKNDILSDEEPVRKREVLNNVAEEPVPARKRASRAPKKTRFKERVSLKKSENSRPPEQNNIVPIPNSANSLTYSNKPFRLDFPAKT